MVESEKSTLSNCVIRGSGKRSSSFGEEIDALYVSSSNSSCVNNLTFKGTSLADQGELDEVESLSTPTIQTSYVKSTPEGSRLSKFKLVDELYNESILFNFDEVNLHNNVWYILADSLMFSKQDDDLVKDKAKLVYDNNQLKIQNVKKRYFDAYNSNVPLEVGRYQSKEMLPKHQDVKLIGTVYPNIPLSSASIHGHPRSSLGTTLGVRMSATAYGNHSTMSSVWPIGASRLNRRPRAPSI